TPSPRPESIRLRGRGATRKSALARNSSNDRQRAEWRSPRPTRSRPTHWAASWTNRNARAATRAARARRRGLSSRANTADRSPRPPPTRRATARRPKRGGRQWSPPSGPGGSIASWRHLSRVERRTQGDGIERWTDVANPFGRADGFHFCVGGRLTVGVVA